MPTENPPTYSFGSTEEPFEQVNASYIVKHWRGQLSLPISYWVNGTLLTVLLTAIMTGVSRSGLIAGLGAQRVGLWVLSVLLLALTCSVWQSVGIWRSADKHPSRGGSKAWATIAKVMVVLALIRLAVFTQGEVPVVKEGLLLALGHDRTPASQLHVIDHGIEVEVSGGITYGTTNALQRLLDATPTIRVVRLNNLGGFITEADRLGQLISARGLSTYTTRLCVSACLLTFIGGKERYLGSRAKLGFHEVSVAGVGGQVAKRGTERFRQALLQRGASAEFIDRALSTSASSMWYPSLDTLLQSHIITSVVEERFVDFAPGPRSFGGVMLGMTAAELLAAKGKPTKTRQAHWIYNSIDSAHDGVLDIYLKDAADGSSARVSAVLYWGKEDAEPAGMPNLLGLTHADLLLRYGAPTAERNAGQGPQYIFFRNGIVVWLEANKVEAYGVYQPAT
jgi:hypothetical protein